MIIASRRLQSSTSTCSKLHSKLNSYSSVMTPPPPLAVSPLSTTGTTTASSSTTKSTDWPADIFSGDSKARAISLLTTDRENSSEFGFKKYEKPAAVLVPFCYDLQGRPGLLYNLRSATLNTHKGEISFPGGTLEPQDKGDAITAALRETHEELGITKDEVTVWTTGRTFPTISSKMGVTPVLGFLHDGPVDPVSLQINPDEVDHAFVISLDHLCDPRNWGEMEPPKLARKVAGRLGPPTFTLPTYLNLHEISERLQGVHLWGLTAFITHLVLTAFIPEKYKRKVPYIELMPEESKQEAKAKENKDKRGSTSTESSTSKL